jgi:non-specific serine/threonine protein kinase
MLPGGVTVSGVQDLAAAVPEIDVDVTAAALRLIDCSLVGLSNHDPPRLEVLPAVRDWAFATTAQLGDERALWQGVQAYLERVVIAKVSEEDRWLAALDAEHDNLRAILGRTLVDDPGTALRLTARLTRFWYLRGHYEEGCAWLEGALAAAPRDATSDRESSLLGAGHLLYKRCFYDQAAVRLVEARAAALELGDARGLASTEQVLGSLAQDRGEHQVAHGHFARALELSRQLGQQREVARCLLALVHLAWYGAEGEAGAIAGEWLNQAESIFRASADHEGIVLALLNRGALQLYAGFDVAARVTLSNAFAESVGSSYREGIAKALHLLGLTSIRRGELTPAHAQLIASLRIHRKLGDLSRCASLLEALACNAIAAEEDRGDHELGAMLLGGAAALRTRIRAPLPPCDRPLVEKHTWFVTQALGADAYEDWRARGRSMSLDDLMGLAATD